VTSGGTDGTVRLWDVRTGKGQTRIGGGTASVFSVTLSPDGKAAAWVDSYGRLRLWDLTRGQERGSRALEGGGKGISSVAFSPDGRTLATGCAGGNVQLWNVRGFVGR
jgi:WD40 repeat protein